MTVSRRTLLAQAAWTTPALLVAQQVPAYAASCQPITVRLDWASAQYTRLTATSGRYTFDPDGPGPLLPLTLTISQTSIGSNTQTGNQARNVNDNLTVSTFTTGGTGDTALTFHQSPINNTLKTNAVTTSNRSTYSFTFNQPVTNLSFSILDIDATIYDFVDGVAITSSSPYTATKANSLFLNGSGTTTDPWRPYNYVGVDNNSTDGNVRVSFPTVSSFNLSYWNLDNTYDPTIDGDQRVFLSDFTTTYTPC